MNEKKKKSLSRPRDKTVKRLFSISGNICYFPDCNQKLTLEKNIIIGMICHIKGNKTSSTRYDKSQTDEERHGIKNLILLCPTHHRVIDTNPMDYTVKLLAEMKKNHEQSVEKVQEASDYIVQQLLFKNIIEDIINYHDNKVKLIENKTVILISIVPLSTFDLKNFYTLDEIASHKKSLIPISYHVIDERFISNMFCRHHRSMTDSDLNSYVCVSRDGTLEALDELIFEPREGKLIMSNPFFENKIKKAISDYLEFYENIECELPLILFISLIGIKNYNMEINIEGKYILGQDVRSHCAIEETLTMSAVHIKDYDTNLEELLKPCFNTIWCAFNYPGRPNYEGEYIWSDYEYFKN